jgi:hypothetical protein
MSDRRAELLDEYKELYLKVEAILFRADPIYINYRHNSDEYSPEVGTILPRLKTASSADEVLNIVHEEFSRWFGAEEIGPKSRFEKIANEVWRVWTESSVSKPKASHPSG